MVGVQCQAKYIITKFPSIEVLFFQAPTFECTEFGSDLMLDLNLATILANNFYKLPLELKFKCKNQGFQFTLIRLESPAKPNKTIM